MCIEGFVHYTIGLDFGYLRIQSCLDLDEYPYILPNIFIDYFMFLFETKISCVGINKHLIHSHFVG
jgi:hypothetical protein